MSHTLTIYDPNHLNPYGIELAATLVDAAAENVSLVLPADRTTVPVQRVSYVRVLAGSRDGLVTKLVRRLLAPFRAWRSSGRRPLVIVWTRDVFDAFVFYIRAAFGYPTFFIYHNPPNIRRRPGFGGAGERMLARRAIVCVHSEELALKLSHTPRRVIVTPHPSYYVTTGAGRQTTQSTPANSHPQSPIAGTSLNQALSRPRVAILGSLRPDKGIANLPSVSASSNGGWDCIVLGPDRIPELCAEELQRADVTIVQPFSAPPTDHELQDALSSCAVMLAPYTSVTESGSVILAHTLGVPTLALRSSALERTIRSSALADDPSHLGILLGRFLQHPWSTYYFTPSDRQSLAVHAWRRALATGR